MGEAGTLKTRLRSRVHQRQAVGFLGSSIEEEARNARADIEEAPEEASANRGFRGLGPCVEGRPPRRYRITTSRPRYGGYSGQPLKSLLGVILVPLLENGAQPSWPTAPLRKAVGIVSPLKALSAQGHHQVFGVFPDQRGHCLAVKFSLALPTDTCCSWRCSCRVKQEKRSVVPGIRKSPDRRVPGLSSIPSKGESLGKATPNTLRSTGMLTGPVRGSNRGDIITAPRSTR